MFTSTAINDSFDKVKKLLYQNSMYIDKEAYIR